MIVNIYYSNYINFEYCSKSILCDGFIFSLILFCIFIFICESIFKRVPGYLEYFVENESKLV